MTDISYFANGNMPYIERARLMKEIDLSKYIIINKEKLQLEYFEPEFVENSSSFGCEYGGYNTNDYWKFNNKKEYKFSHLELPTYIEAPFFIPILAALYKGDKPNKTKTSSPNKRGFKGDALTTSSIESTNYINLKIPRYILLQYIEYIAYKDPNVKIPKDTEFLIASVGGQLLAENIRIIGLWDL